MAYDLSPQLVDGQTSTATARTPYLGTVFSRNTKARLIWRLAAYTGRKSSETPDPQANHGEDSLSGRRGLVLTRRLRDRLSVSILASPIPIGNFRNDMISGANIRRGLTSSAVNVLESGLAERWV